MVNIYMCHVERPNMSIIRFQELDEHLSRIALLPSRNAQQPLRKISESPKADFSHEIQLLEGIQNISKYISSLLTHRPWHCSFITLQSMRTFMIFMSICRISARIATWQIFEWRVFPTTHVGRWRQLHDTTTCLQNQENFQKAELCGPRFACLCFLLISFSLHISFSFRVATFTTP